MDFIKLIIVWSFFIYLFLKIVGWIFSFLFGWVMPSDSQPKELDTN